MEAGLAEGLLSRLLVAVPPVMDVATEAASSKGSTATATLEDAEEDEEESRPVANAPCLSEGEEGEDAGEDVDEEEEEEEDGEDVEANMGVASSGSRQTGTSCSSFALVEAGLGLGLGVGVGVGVGGGIVTGSGVGVAFGSPPTLSAGISTPSSACSTTSPCTTVPSAVGEPTDTEDISKVAPASAASVVCRVEGVALQRLRRALRRRSARVRLLILPSLLRRPTLRLLGVTLLTTPTSLSRTLVETSLASLMVSFRDSSLVRPDLHTNTPISVCATPLPW